jgi:hypothetical protein
LFLIETGEQLEAHDEVFYDIYDNVVQDVSDEVKTILIRELIVDENKTNWSKVLDLAQGIHVHRVDVRGTQWLGEGGNKVYPKIPNIYRG